MKSLKDENKLQLSILIGTPILITLAIQLGYQKVIDILNAGKLIGLTLIATTILTMVANLIPQAIKHKLVFLRIRDELPGCRCHVICKKDNRLDFNAINAKWPSIFSDSTPKSKRNSLWYHEIYRKVRDRPQVESSHKNFLLYRDATSGMLIIFIASLACYWSNYKFPLLGSIELPALFIQAIILIIAIVSAQNSGNRMVVNAIVESV
ncbi:hypothetical protein ACFFU8_11455 [Chromobacterium piscinae]|uniref:hypothetical protein n=1 Tax=Chromobacterium piscinae TaxID=686831 RepID=UPI001E36D043|nr:hypothetical protein [Chromobacterium piscinae]MCD5327539.1 hypothetical protein [Chromobacterium piscinae]